MFFDINIYHDLVRNTVKIVLLSITEIEFSHRSDFFFMGDLEVFLRGL